MKRIDTSLKESQIKWLEGLAISTEESRAEHIRRAIDAYQQKIRAHDRKMNELVTGVLFDFMGFLTTKKKSITLSSSHNATPGVDAIQEFLAKRQITDSDPDFEWPQKCQRRSDDV